MRRSFLFPCASVGVTGLGIALLSIAFGSSVVVAAGGAAIALFGGIGSAWSVSAR